MSGSAVKSPPPSGGKMMRQPAPVAQPSPAFASNERARDEEGPPEDPPADPPENPYQLPPTYPGEGPPDGSPYQGYGGDPDNQGFEYWNQPTDGSWLADILENPPPNSDQICGLYNFTTGEGTQFKLRFVNYFPGNANFTYSDTNANQRSQCKLCEFGQKLAVGQQFVATTCTMPCKHSESFATDAECTLACIFPLGIAAPLPRLALPAYEDVDTTLESFSNQYVTGMAAYASFLVNVGCRLEDRPSSYTSNIGGFSPSVQLCSVTEKGLVTDGSCSPFFLAVPEEGLNSCPTDVAIYGDDLLVGWLAISFAQEDKVFIFPIDHSIPFQANRLTHYQVIGQSPEHHAPRFGTSLSFSANDELFGGERPERVLLSVGAYGDVASTVGATFIFQAVQDFEDLDVFTEFPSELESKRIDHITRITYGLDEEPVYGEPVYGEPVYVESEDDGLASLEEPPDEDFGIYYTDFVFFEVTPAIMSSYNYPVRYEYGFVTALDFNSVALVSIDPTSGSWDFVSYRECAVGDQWTDDSCQPCPSGQYSSSLSYDPCILCPSAHFLPRHGSHSEDACISCNRGEFCAAGATVPINQAQADQQVYAINNPDPKASPQLHFETTFFYSVVPPAAILGFVLMLCFLPFAINCLNRFKPWRSLRNFLQHVNLIDDKRDMISAFFTIWLIISIIFLIVFAILFHAEVNDSLEVNLKTLDDVTDLGGDDQDLVDIDVVPFQVSVAFIDLIDYVTCDDKAFKVTIDGCLYNYDECRPDIHFKQSRIMETGVRVCNVTMGFPQGTELNRDARFTISTQESQKRFYAQMVWYKVSSLNDKHSRIGGNSYISGVVQPIPGHILRGEGEVNILTTLTPLLDCTSNEVQWRNFLLITAEDKCDIERGQSLKSYSPLSNTTSDADVQDFYIPTRDLADLSGYSFSVVLEKGRYYELKKTGYYVTEAQIAILVILLIFGFWWGFLQLIKYMIDRFSDWVGRTWVGVVDR